MNDTVSRGPIPNYWKKPFSPGEFVHVKSRTMDGFFEVAGHSPETGWIRVITPEGNEVAVYDWQARPDTRAVKVEQAKKFDDGKPRMDIVLGINGLDLVGQVFTHGAKKYGDFNWRRGDLAFRGRMLAACMRHLMRYATGEKLDKESGLPHLAHAISNLLMILDLESKQ